MRRLAILSLVLPFAALACTEAEPADTDVTDDAVTTVVEFPALEANLGLIKDPARTRSEATLKAGPCYQRMEASGRTWNLRRYTRGAAFFFTDEEGKPMDAIECVDVDVLHNGKPSTMPLRGLSLDIAQRFDLGRFDKSAWTGSPVGSGTAMLAFERGSLEIRTGAFEESDQNAFYGAPSFSGIIRAMDVQSFPLAPSQPYGDPMLANRRFMPGVALLAYRYTKKHADVSMAKDPIGHFVSIESPIMGAGDAITRYVHFERATIAWTVTGAGDGGEWLSLKDDATGEQLAACFSDMDESEPAFSCSVRPQEGRWEIPWGSDLL